VTRRNIVLCAAATAAALAVANGYAMLDSLDPAKAISPENAARIQPGMSRAEVKAILGGPARIAVAGPSVFIPVSQFPRIAAQDEKSWTSDDWVLS
jgi:outer membrane protein assembly factor BamE (lipoprotein component of BamABCDE complex)